MELGLDEPVWLDEALLVWLAEELPVWLAEFVAEASSCVLGEKNVAMLRPRKVMDLR